MPGRRNRRDAPRLVRIGALAARLRRQNGGDRLARTGAVVLGRPARELDDVGGNERLASSTSRIGLTVPRSHRPRRRARPPRRCRSPSASRAARPRARRSTGVATPCGTRTSGDRAWERERRRGRTQGFRASDSAAGSGFNCACSPGAGSLAVEPSERLTSFISSHTSRFEEGLRRRYAG